ncbi:MAG: acyl-CoA dehydrogenase family protein [Myxococcota bacterium]
MDFTETPELAAFRLKVRRWFEENLPEGWGTEGVDGPRTAGERVAFAKQWQKRLYDGGWAGISWPREYGGTGASITEQMIYGEEYARAWAPDLIMLGVGMALTGPVLMSCGKPWQKERFISKILTAEEIWCQGFSEPGARSDLAALRMRADVQGDEVVVTGQKVWTSFAQYADWCILVVKTDSDAPRKHDGMTFLLVDMKSPGIDVRPLTEITGEDWFNEVFFDHVRVPIENVVGEIDRGWDVVINTLSLERASAAPHARLEAELSMLRDLARRLPRGSGTAAQDPVIREKLAQCSIEVTALRVNALRNVGFIEQHGVPGPQGSLLKLGWSELDQRIKTLAGEILGPYALLLAGDARAIDGGHWAHEILWSRAATIYAGTSEVQRNIIAERVLGLPRH